MGFTEGFATSMGIWIVLGVMTCTFPVISFKTSFNKTEETEHDRDDRNYTS